MGRDSMTRRDFMRVSAGAAAAVPASKVTMLKAAARSQASGRSVPPSDMLRFASIGTGVRGCEDLQTALRAGGTDMVATCDLWDGRLIAAQEHAGKKLDTTKDYRQILDRKDIDFVLVTTSDNWHAKVVEDACAAGKDCYVEKPMTHHSVAQGYQIIDAAKKYNRIVQVGSQETSIITYLKAKEIYESGALGQVTAVDAAINRNDASGAWVYPIPPGANEQTIDWNTFLGDAPKQPFDAKKFFRWRAYREFGDGLPGDLFVHVITGIYTVMGIQGPPQRAVSSGGVYRWDNGRNEPDMLWTLYSYPGYVMSIHCNLNNSEGDDYTYIYGTKGTLKVGDGSVTFTPQDTTPRPERYSVQGWPKKLREEYWKKWYEEHPKPSNSSLKVVEGSHTYRAPDGYDGDVAHMDSFLNAVRNRTKPDEDAVFGNWTAIACHMASYSYFNKTEAVWHESERQIRSS